MNTTDLRPSSSRQAGTLTLTVWPDTPVGEHQRYGYRIEDTETGRSLEGRDLFTGAGAPVAGRAQLRGHRRRGLVRQDDVRVVDERARHTDALLLAARELAGQVRGTPVISSGAPREAAPDLPALPVGEVTGDSAGGAALAPTGGFSHTVSFPGMGTLAQVSWSGPAADLPERLPRRLAELEALLSRFSTDSEVVRLGHTPLVTATASAAAHG